MRRRLVREFPLFFFYLAFHVVNDSTGLVFNLMYGGKSVPYVYSYWVGQAIGTSLRFVVIYEVFLKIFEPYDALQRAGSIIFRCATLFLLLVALLAAVTGGNGDPQWAIHGVVTLDRSINVVQCGLLVTLFLASSYFGLTWRHHVSGIALGFGLIAGLELLSAALWSELGPIADMVLDFLPRFGFLGALFLWSAYLLGDEPERLVVHDLPQNNLDEWNQELLQLLQR